MKYKYPIIDLFAGPGGLGEGFCSYIKNNQGNTFESIVSIEQNEFAHQTLLLRHFYRQFPQNTVPEDYYQYLEGSITINDLKERYPDQFQHAEKSALRISLGEENHDLVKSIINDKLGPTKKWALVGGPPCQAYSLVGRSRMMGDPEFEKDERHFLYKEYLRIIIDHKPPVFVMENVKGLLSAKINGEPVIDKIMRDLSAPGVVVKGYKNGLGYNLYSLSENITDQNNIDPRSFIVKSELYGVPQARHRMFIVGVRSDLNVKPGILEKEEPPSVSDMISSLPAIRSSVSRRKDCHEEWKTEVNQAKEAGWIKNIEPEIRKIILKAIDNILLSTKHTSSTKYIKRKTNLPLLNSVRDDRMKTVTCHEARGHMPSDLHRYIFSAAFAAVKKRSPKISEFPEALLPNHKNIELARSGKMFSDRFRVQVKDSFSTTITSHISKDGHYFIHYDPEQVRSLTVREAARLQTFPDNYKFEGPRTAQYHQVGNAVPPYLATQIAAIIEKVLDKIPED